MTDAQKIDRLESVVAALTVERDALRKIFNILMLKIMEEKDERVDLGR